MKTFIESQLAFVKGFTAETGMSGKKQLHDKTYFFIVHNDVSPSFEELLSHLVSRWLFTLPDTCSVPERAKTKSIN